MIRLIPCRSKYGKDNVILSDIKMPTVDILEEGTYNLIELLNTFLLIFTTFTQVSIKMFLQRKTLVSFCR